MSGPAPEMSAHSLLDQCGPTQRRLLEALLQRPRGLSVGGLTDALGITANAVRQHLTALEGAGFVRHEAVPAGRGRPQFVYHLSERGREAFPRRYRELAEIVLGELAGHLGESALKGAMRRMGVKAAEALGGEPASLPATAQVMKQLGYEATVRKSPRDGEEIVARNCVFHRLAAQQSAVCQFDLGFLEAATGRKVEHRECMVRGGTCCRFGFTARRK